MERRLPAGLRVFAFPNEGRPNRYYVETLGEYLGITRSWEIPGVGTFAGYAVTGDPAGFEVWNDPAREIYGGGGPRWKSWTYHVMGGQWMFEDERQVPPGHHDNIDNVAVPGKTMWMHCKHSGSYQYGVWGWHEGVHMGEFAVVFNDGHAQDDQVQPFNDHWLATGGVPRSPQSPAEYGLYAYTYPPELNEDSLIAGARWWVPPYYPSGPVYDQQ